MTEGNRIDSVTRWTTRHSTPGAMQLSKRPSLPSRLSSHLLQHFIDDGPVNELVQIGQRLSLWPAEFRRGSRFEKVFDQILWHFQAVFESLHHIAFVFYDILMSLMVPPKRGMWTY